MGVNRHTRPPTPDTVQRLRRLLERRDRAKAAHEETVDALYLGAAEACDVEGASLGEVAKALGVGKTTVRDWRDRGRQLRDR